MSECLKCINSACCKLEVEVDRNEYEKFEKKGLGDYFKTRTEDFLKKNEKYRIQKHYFDEMYKDNYAKLIKGIDGLCVMLDRKTMLCSIYKDRPKVCKDYKIKSCVNIKNIKK